MALAPDAIISLAKTQLSLTSAYIEELRNHLELYPHDAKFRVTPQPKKGFGTVTCLEDGCNNASIALIQRVKTNDGGLRDGIGSLAPYRVHIENHATHKKNRLARIKAGGAVAVASPGPSRITVKKEGSLLDALNAGSPFGTPKYRPIGGDIAVSSSSPAAPSSPAMNPVAKRSSLVRVTPRVKPEPVEATFRRALVKPEPVESTIPRKRVSDVALEERVAKQAKQELLEDAKIPLAQATNYTASAVTTPPDIEGIRAKIASTQITISHLQSVFDRISRKKKKTKTDNTRMQHHAQELQRLKKQKADLDASLPRAPPAAVASQTHRAEAQPHHFGFGAPPPTVVAQPFDLKPAQHANALASGSKGITPVASGSKGPAPALSDDEMDVDPVITLNKYLHAIPNIMAVGDSRDENGDFHGRGRDTFQGPQAKADDIDKFLIEAGNAELFDGNASIDKALEKLGLQSTHELLPSLDIPLMPHQLLCVAWMVANEREKSIKGGCLADEMGLGKTVQMIATMCKNPSDNASCKTTLIISPLALLTQWNQEISTKTNAEWKVLIYHGSNKPKKKSDILAYDVILTTYSNGRTSRRKRRKGKKPNARKSQDDFIVSDSDDSGSDRPKNKKKKDRGLLFQVDFYRVVLDEAQNIRNKRTRVSRAVTDLNAKYRWCLTATPIVNNLSDVYGYLRFLRVRPWYDWKEFNDHVGKLEKKNPQLAVTRLQAILNLFLMRRMKTTLLDGKRLIELPEKTVELVTLMFSQEERDIYNQASNLNNITERLLNVSLLKNYASVLVLLLRLRQLCSHPALIQENGSHFLAADEVDDPEEYRDELARARSIMPADFVKKMKEKFKERALSRMQTEQQSQETAADVDDCPICFDALTAPVVTACGHEFCKECLDDVLATPRPEQVNDRYKADERPCPACRSPICSEKLFASAAFEPSDKDLQGDVDGEDSDVEMLDEKPSAVKKFVVLDSSDVEAEAEQDSASEDDYKDSDMSDFIVESDEDEEEKDARLAVKKRGKRRAITRIVDSDDEMEEVPEEKEIVFGKKPRLSKAEIKVMPRFLPSTKMKAMMEVILGLAKDHPDEKTLVVSQWTGCLNIVSDYLTEKGILHVNAGASVSTLTRANNVVSLDLGWSPAIDQQAFDRVHRLGQHRKVIVKRMVIENSVEDRILALQQRKQDLADGSLGEGKGKKLGRLSVRDLANLFGLDARGRVLAGGN
ncbi:SNF2 superfamily protein [Mycena olivaceomarginata]|nr:SNF2 superfamily protein [Mycena olivaceomarginata]